MANVLEGLIAKGRRVHHARDQREVAFGLADLSTHGDLHERIVKKGGVKTLLHLLVASRDVEAQRFSALAIANTACAKSHRVDIALQENALLHLTDFIRNDDADLAGRQYCAMALGNLAADPENHSNIAMIGGIEALVKFLKFAAKEQNLEAGRYTTFALSNMAANSSYRQQIVDEGAIESLVLIACSDDVDVQRQALAALRGLCISYDLRHLVVEAGILDPLVLMARSENVDILQEVAAALNCLSSVAENKSEVGDRATSTIISLLFSGDQVVERHACCAIANLAESSDIHARIIDESGLPPIVAMFSSKDLNCKGEAARAIANFSANSEVHSNLLSDEILDVVVGSLSDAEINCQRFAALCLANLATTVTSQIGIVQAGAVRPLVQLVGDENVQLEARRYAALALANLSATSANHVIILEEKSLEACFTLSNSPDVLSQYYTACTLANLGSNVENHLFIVEEGGIQPLIALVYSKDPDVHLQASAALRGLSATEQIKTKMVQEGCIEPLSRLLLSKDFHLLREVSACLCNLSISDENKIELAKSGMITPLISLMQHDDMQITTYSCACLANLAEIAQNREVIVSEGAIKVCIIVMRSRFIEVQREGGRLLANICACDLDVSVDAIIEHGGHNLLISYLLSRDVACQRVGAFGIGNLCTHQRHRVTLKDARVLELLKTLVRSDEVHIEIQKFAMLAIVNLSDEVHNHQTFVDDRILHAMISLSASKELEIRQYAAMAVANVAKNMDLRQIVTEEGGLEPVLYLARTGHPGVCKEILKAVSTLSFVNKNKEDICNNGGMIPILQQLKNEESDISASRFACCTVANLCERIENMSVLVKANVIPLIIRILKNQSQHEVVTEATRALGNFSTNLDYAEMISRNKDVIENLVSLLANGTINCQRMAGMTLSNLASNEKCHQRICNTELMDHLVIGFRNALDTKLESDYEVTRYSLLLVANLSICDRYHDIILERILDYLVKFAGHRDIKCRQNAIIALGNLSSRLANTHRLSSAGSLPILVSFSFPPVEADSTNAQFQSIAGLRGLALNDNLRVALVAKGCCEPLILAGGDKGNQILDIEVRREAAAAMCNLALSNENCLVMAQSGIVSALVSLMKLDDTVAQVFAVGTLANLSESGRSVQSRLLSDGCLTPLIDVAIAPGASGEVKEEVARCVALFANELESHDQIMSNQTLQCLMHLLTDQENLRCSRFVSLALADLALSPRNHDRLLQFGTLEALHKLMDSRDIETLQCVSFALHNICKNEKNHAECEQKEVALLISTILAAEDEFAKLHACLALRYLSISKKGGAQFVDNCGLPRLLELATSGDIESKLEAVASLRNLSMSNENKTRILREGGMPVLVSLARSNNHQLSHHACGVLANIAESSANQGEMVNEGILHHLKFGLRSTCGDVIREALRTICNISSDFNSTSIIANSGLLVPLVHSLSSKEVLPRRFACIAIANLATNDDIQPRLVEEGVLQPMLFLSSEANSKDTMTTRYAFSALSNISAYEGHHGTLIQCGVVDLASSFLIVSDEMLVSSAALCLSNLASNTANHKYLEKARTLDTFLPFLASDNRRMQLRTVSFIRGLSTSKKMREVLLALGIIQKLLKYATTEDIEIQLEILAALCNLSLSNCVGENPDYFLKKIHMSDLVSFVCSSDSTYRLFGAVTIGNIASKIALQPQIVSGGAISPLIDTVGTANLECQRCIAYALCNLCAEPSNRTAIVRDGGLFPIFSMARSTDENDVCAALSTLRGLSSCEENRRHMVDKGGLEALFEAMKTFNNPLCLEEAGQALCWISLDDENKISIVRHADFGIIFGLTMIDSEFLSSVFLRILSNCSELSKLHGRILDKLNCSSFLENHTKSHKSTTSSEFTRFLSNMCGNNENHETLFEMDVLNSLLKKMNHSDDTVVLHAILSIMNLSSKLTNHCRMINRGAELIESLLSKCNMGLSVANSTKWKRYSCVTIGCLLMSDEFYSNLIDRDVTGILYQLLRAETDPELLFNVSFALHQVVKHEKGVQVCYGEGFEDFMLKLVGSSNTTMRIHAIGTLRYLSLNADIALKIATKTGLSSLANAADFTSNEIIREIMTTICHLSVPLLNKLNIVNSPALHSILKCCQVSDTECARFALGGLSNCAENIQTHPIILRNKNTIKMLIKLMRNKALPLKREASRAISNLLSNKMAMDLFIESNGLISIRHLATSLDCECQYNVTLSLRKLTSRTENHDVIIAKDLLHHMISLCKLEDNLSAVRHAISALRDLASNRHMKVLVANEGGIIVAIQLLDSEDGNIRVTSSALLHHLSISSLLKNSFHEQGVVSPLCRRIKNLDDIDLLYHGAGILSNIAEHEKAKELLWQPCVVSAITTMTQTNLLDVHQQVARCLSFMSTAVFEEMDEDLMIQLMKDAILLIPSEDPQVAKDAVSAVGNFATNLSRQELLFELEVFPPVANLVTGGCRRSRLPSCWTLSRIMIPDLSKPQSSENTKLLECLIHMCSSSDIDELTFASVALCNISVCKKSHQNILSIGGVTALLSNLSATKDECVESCIKCLCNLSTSKILRRKIVSENGINLLMQVIEHGTLRCRESAIMTLCNIAIGKEYGEVISTSGAIQKLSDMLMEESAVAILRASALIYYNLSMSESCHRSLSNAIKSITHLCKSSDTKCRQYSMMTLCNLAANDDTRIEATKNGGLQTSVIMLRDSDTGCKIYACVCLANLANNKNTQSQVVLHGGLPSLTSHLTSEDTILVRSAMLCIVNIAANTSNHNALLSHGTFRAIKSLQICTFNCSDLGAFVFSNLVSNDDLLEIVGTNDGIEVMTNLVTSDNLHYKCIALSSLRRLAETQENRSRLLKARIFRCLNVNGSIDEIDIQREIATCILNLSKDQEPRKALTDTCITTLVNLLKVDDADILCSATGALANLAEEETCLTVIVQHELAKFLPGLLKHEDIAVYREVARLVSNLLSAFDLHEFIIENGLSSLLKICGDKDADCRRYASLGCRKIATTPNSHPIIIRDGLENLTQLLQSDDMMTVRNTLTTLRDMGATSTNRYMLVGRGTVEAVSPLVSNKDSQIQLLAIAVLRHLSQEYELKYRVMTGDIVSNVISLILGAPDGLLSQIAGLLANLSELDDNRAKMVKAGVVPALIVLSRADHIDILQDISRALANLSAKIEKQFDIHQQGGMACLLKLTNVNDIVCSRYVTTAIELLVTNSHVRQTIVKEQGLDAIISLSKGISLEYQLCFTVTMSLFSSDEESRMDVALKGLHPTLLLCKSKDLHIQRKCLSVLANLSDSRDTHQMISKGGAIKLLADLIDGCTDLVVVREMTRFLASISIDDTIRDQILQHNILPSLQRFSRRTDSATQRYSSLAICNLCLHTRLKENMIESDGLVRILIFLSRCADIEVERCAILSMAALALGTKYSYKEVITENGVLHPILQTMRYPDVEMQQCSSLALNSLLLSNADGVKVKVKEMKDDLTAIFSLLTVPDDECIHNGVYIIGSLVESAEVRNVLVSLGCIESVTKIMASSSIETKRACGYLFSILAECAEYHTKLADSGAMKEVINLAGLVDLECQLYGAFSLVFLASNPSLQVPLVKMGAVRHLVSMMATESEPCHYAGLALLKLADNFENHITIAEEGGIEALLKLGRSRVSDDESAYRAAISVGNLAAQAVANLPKFSQNGLAPNRPSKSRTASSSMRAHKKA